MNQLRLTALMLVLPAGSAFASVDPGLLGLVMPDAKIITGVRVEQAAASPLGQYLLSQMQSNNSGFQRLLGATGFDPQRDLKEILAASNADSGGGPNPGIVLGRGTFQPALIVTAVTAVGGTVTQYGGIDLITSSNKHGSSVSIAFLGSTAQGDSIFVTGGTEAVKATIDRRSGPPYSGPLAQPALAASATNQAWFATSSPSEFLSKRLGNANLGNLTQGNLLQAVVAASGGINFGSAAVTLNADAVTTSSQNAQALAEVLKFISSMLQSNSPKNPALGSLASSATFAANGSVMHLTMSLPEQQVEQLLVPPAAGARRHAAVR